MNLMIFWNWKLFYNSNSNSNQKKINYRIKKKPKTYSSAFFYWSKNFDFISNMNREKFLPFFWCIIWFFTAKMDGSRVCQLKWFFIWLPEEKLWISVSYQSFANNIYFYMRFLYNFGVAICKYHAARPLHSFNKCWKLYSAEICKIVGMSFLGQQSCVRASRASSAQKLQGLRVVYSKKE